MIWDTVPDCPTTLILDILLQVLNCFTHPRSLQILVEDVRPRNVHPVPPTRGPLHILVENVRPRNVHPVPSES